MLSLLTEYADCRKAPTGFMKCLNVMNEGESEVESEVTQRQSHSAKTTLRVAIMMQGMLHIKRKVLGSSSLARCDGSSVCSARSFTRKVCTQKELH